MSGKDLFEGMSYVDERFVDEAENKTLPKRTASPWIKVASMAACLCLIIFSIFNLNQYLNRDVTEGPMGENLVDKVSPGKGAESEKQQESQQAPIAPAYGAAGEVPSVILRVDQMTETGFIGTVAELVDTDIFEIGMELNVVIADGTRNETAGNKPSMAADSKTDCAGSYVMVQFIKYNEENNTIVVNIIQAVESPEATH